MRAVPFGVIRAYLDHEAIALRLTASPDARFPEPGHLADVLTPRFRRFGPLLPP